MILAFRPSYLGDAGGLSEEFVERRFSMVRQVVQDPWLESALTTCAFQIMFSEMLRNRSPNRQVILMGFPFCVIFRSILGIVCNMIPIVGKHVWCQGFCCSVLFT